MTNARFGLTEVRLAQLEPGRDVPGRAREGERLRLHVVRSGRVAVESDGRCETLLQTGEAVFLLADNASTLRAVRASELLTIVAPAEVARDVWTRRAATTVQRVSRSAVLLLPVTAFAARVLREPEGAPSGVGRYYVERLLQEMLQGLLVDACRLGPLQQAPDPFRLAMSILSAQYADPELSAAAVADEVNLSLRQLEREFRKNGTTIRRELRGIRVEQAGRLLRDPQYDALSVDQVARFVGFSGGSSLARAMAASGQPSPSVARAQPSSDIPTSLIPEATTSIPFSTGS